MHVSWISDWLICFVWYRLNSLCWYMQQSCACYMRQWRILDFIKHDVWQRSVGPRRWTAGLFHVDWCLNLLLQAQPRNPCFGVHWSASEHWEQSQWCDFGERVLSVWVCSCGRGGWVWLHHWEGCERCRSEFSCEYNDKFALMCFHLHEASAVHHTITKHLPNLVSEFPGRQFI